jgi:hypothetical protein
MSISPLVGATPDTPESVDIQLTLEGLEFCLLEVLGHYCLREVPRIKNFEGLSSRLPGDQILEPLLLSLLQQRMKLARKASKVSFCVFGRHLIAVLVDKRLWWFSSAKWLNFVRLVILGDEVNAVDPLVH